MTPRRTFRLVALVRWLLAVSLGAAASSAFAAPPPLEPFQASFEVVFRGMNAGTSSLELTRDNGNRWRYVSRNEARGLFKLALPGEIRQTSLFVLEDDRPRPLRYIADDGTKATDKDITLEFDWAASRVRGTAELKPVDLPLQAGLQDGMSVQIALLRALAAGERPSGFRLIDKDEVKEYVYVDEGRATLRTVAGEVDTVVWSSHRPNSDRVTRVWYAPSLGFLPVQAERKRGDRLEWSMRLKSYRR
jgi:hypothetical protein